jgi:hypothetical protein
MRLVDGQGALEQGVGALEVALVVQDEAEVVEGPGGVGVVGAKANAIRFAALAW